MQILQRAIYLSIQVVPLVEMTTHIEFGRTKYNSHIKKFIRPPLTVLA